MNQMSLLNLSTCLEIGRHSFAWNRIDNLPPFDEAAAAHVPFPIVRPQVHVVVDVALAFQKYIP